jgi:hypothetical protein
VRRTALVAVLLLLLAAGLATFWLARDDGGGRGGETVPAVDPKAFDLGDPVAGFLLEVPAPAPTGAPIEVPRVHAAGTAFRTQGSFRYVQVAEGTFGPEGKKPRRAVWGTVETTTRVEAGTPSRVAVEGELRTTDVAGDSAPRSRADRFTLSFDLASGGAAERRSLLLRVPDDLRDLLETLTAHWTDPVPLPDRPVRVGDVFEPTVAIDVDPWRRTMWEIFQKGNPARPPVVVAVEGGAWVAGREAHDHLDDVLVVRTAFNHAHAQEAGPFGRDAVRIGYAAAQRGTRRVAVRDGLALTYDVSMRRRIRAQGEGFDYTVDTLEQSVLQSVRGP